MSQRWTLWLCIAIFTILGSCGSTGDKAPDVSLRKLNVVFVTIDTLRPDRLGCYGYSQIETPNLDRLAHEGVLFENAAAQAPLTAPSIASMLTGTYPTVHGVRDTGSFVLGPSHLTLTEILQEKGWDTAAFVGSSVLKRRFGFDQGFAVYDDEMPRSGPSRSSEEYPERRAGEVVDRAIGWLESQSGKPFFLWVHVFDPHYPYDPPAPFREKYRGRPYDGEIAYTDQELGRLFEAVRKKSPPENTIVAVLSDHGESFSEHGEYAHGVFLYDTTLRIVFILKGPGVPEGLRIKQQARSIDLLPTLLELMGGQAPPEVQGVSLTPVFSGKETQTEYSYAETLFPKINMGWAELRGVRTNRWKYVRAPKPELYDLVQDPDETNNVIASHPTEVRRLEAKLEEITRRASGQGPETVKTAAPDRQTLEQLRSLGYVGGSSPREYVLTGRGTDPKDRLDVLELLHLAVYSDSNLPLSRRMAMLRQAVTKDPANPALYSNLGDLYRGAGRSGEEMQLYRDAVNHGVQSAWLYSRLGSLYIRQGNRQEAIIFLEQAAQWNPSDYDSLQNLAVAYRETGRIADAEKVLLSILKSGEDYAPAYNELGMVYFQKRDLALAHGYFEKAAQLDPAYQLNLGRLYRMLGDNLRARSSYEAFLAAAATRPEYRDLIPQARQELAGLR